MSDDLVILYSGGADSRLMLELALRMGRKPYCVLIDYRQLHAEELDVAEKQLNKLGIPYHVVDIENLNVKSGLTGDGIKNDTGQVHEMYVSGRNTIFLGIAFSIAESKDINTIWIGSDWSDRINLFPDCYQEYFVRVNEMLKFAGPKNVRVEAPILGLTKENVLSLLSAFGIDKKEIFSGYGGL